MTNFSKIVEINFYILLINLITGKLRARPLRARTVHPSTWTTDENFWIYGPPDGRIRTVDHVISPEVDAEAWSFVHVRDARTKNFKCKL